MRAFVINLRHATERMEAFRRNNAWMFRQSGGPLFCERFEAIDGHSLTEPEPYHWTRRGNLASHIELWRRAAEWSVPTMICEDDALVLEADYAAEMVDDDTMLVCGFNWDMPLALSYGLGAVVLHHDQATLREMMKNHIIPPPSERMLSWRLVHCFGTPCYIITPHGARRLLAEALPIQLGYINMPTLHYQCENRGIDYQLNIHYFNLGARVLFPPRAFTPNIMD